MRARSARRPRGLAPRLNWAVAAGRPDEVVRAATHLPGASLTQTRVLELRAWIAARSGDRPPSERPSRRSSRSSRPMPQPLSDSPTWPRRTASGTDSPSSDAARQILRKRGTTTGSRSTVPSCAPFAADLARAADGIGRRFDAAAWWRIAAQRDPTLEPEAAAARARLAKAEAPRPAAERSPICWGRFVRREQPSRCTRQAERAHVR